MRRCVLAVVVAALTIACRKTPVVDRDAAAFRSQSPLRHGQATSRKAHSLDLLREPLAKLDARW